MADWPAERPTDPRAFPMLRHWHPNGTLDSARDRTPTEVRKLGWAAAPTLDLHLPVRRSVDRRRWSLARNPERRHERGGRSRAVPDFIAPTWASRDARADQRRRGGPEVRSRAPTSCLRCTRGSSRGHVTSPACGRRG